MKFKIEKQIKGKTAEEIIDYSTERICAQRADWGRIGDNNVRQVATYGLKESGYCAASAIMEHFDNPSMVCEAYQQSTESLKFYMVRQRNLVGGMVGTFREMEGRFDTYCPTKKWNQGI